MRLRARSVYRTKYSYIYRPCVAVVNQRYISCTAPRGRAAPRDGLFLFRPSRRSSLVSPPPLDVVLIIVISLQVSYEYGDGRLRTLIRVDNKSDIYIVIHPMPFPSRNVINDNDKREDSLSEKRSIYRGDEPIHERG